MRNQARLSTKIKSLLEWKDSATLEFKIILKSNDDGYKPFKERQCPEWMSIVQPESPSSWPNNNFYRSEWWRKEPSEDDGF
jgi:hypothetical protein